MNSREILLREIYPKVYSNLLAVLYGVEILSRTLMACSTLGVVKMGLANVSESSVSRRKAIKSPLHMVSFGIHCPACLLELV